MGKRGMWKNTAECEGNVGKFFGPFGTSARKGYKTAFADRSDWYKYNYVE